MNPQRIVLILVAGFALGSTASVTRLGVAEIHPVTLVALRFAIATLAFAMTLAVIHSPLPQDKRAWFDIVLVGLTQGFQLLSFTIALQYISSAVVVIFIAMVPLFTGVMAHLWLAQERLTLAKGLGLIVAFAGVLFLILTRTTGLAGIAGGFEVSAQLLALAGAIISAAGVVYARRRLRAVDAVVVTAGQMATGFVLTLPFAVILNTTNIAAVTWHGWFAMLYSAMIGSYLGFLLLFYMVKRFSATVSVLPAYLMPPVSATLGAIFLGEIITLPLIGSAILILVGLFLASK